MITVEVIKPEPVIVEDEIVLRMSRSDAEKLKLLANGSFTSVYSFDRRGAIVRQFQNDIWDQLENKMIEAFQTI